GGGNFSLTLQPSQIWSLPKIAAENSLSHVLHLATFRLLRPPNASRPRSHSDLQAAPLLEEEQRNVPRALDGDSLPLIDRQRVLLALPEDEERAFTRGLLVDVGLEVQGVRVDSGRQDCREPAEVRRLLLTPWVVPEVDHTAKALLAERRPD